MRVILDPGGDVLLTPGRTLAELRPELVRLTDRPEWATATLWLDGRPLADDHVAGVPPWLAGSALGLTAPPGDVADADDGPVPPPPTTPRPQLVVLDGPAAGTTADGDATTVLGRGARGRHGERRRGGALVLADPLVSRAHAVVRRRRHGWTVRDLGSANGTTLLAGPARRRPGEPRRLVPRVPRRARAGDALRLASSLVLLDGPPGPPARTATVLRAARHPTVLVMLAGGLLISAITGSTTFLVLALLAPLSALAARLGATRDADDDGRDRPGAGRHGTTTTAGAGRTDGPDGADTDPVAGLRVVGGLPLLVDARDSRRATADRDGPPPWWPLAAEGLAVRGPWATGVARGLVLDALAGPGCRLTALLGASGWDWLRWAEAPLAGGRRVARTAEEATAALGDVPGGPLLVLDEHGSAWRPQVHRWFARRRPEDAVVVVVAPGDEAPPWCRWTLTVGPEGAVLAGDGTHRAVVAPPVTTATAEAVARSRAPGWTAGDADLPTRVGWSDLGLPRTAAEVLATWSGSAGTGPAGAGSTVGSTPRAADGGPTARLGLGPHGRPVDVDLRRDGPHALVAGTTGAGKSELLQTFLLSLATTHPPDELAVVLVDYKGGAGFGECARLPHVVGTVTDLDAAASARALAALRTELRRREHLVAAAGVADLDGLRRVDHAAPPRLLVLVDEFRALVEDLPDFVPGLVRVATQGRSLGVHLVLATQRPAGVVDAQLRANLPLRMCLRVADDADSLDVVDVPDAAAVPASLPGRALVRRPGGDVEHVQTAWAALPTAAAEPVRWAPPWASAGPDDDGDAARPDPDAVARLVDEVREAHARTGRPPPEAPWLPPLPATVHLEDLPDGPGTIRLALGDRPDLRRREVVAWEPRAGALLVGGGPASGRTTTLRTVAHVALRAGWHVHVVAQGSREDWVGADLRGGTVAGPDDPGRVARLLDRVVTGTCGPTLLVVDDVGVVQQALGLLPRGAAEGLLDRVVREGRLRGLATALAGTPSDLARHLPHSALRLVHRVPDDHDARLLGATTVAGGPPGRAVAVGAGHEVVCQVALTTGPPHRSRPGGDPPGPGRGPLVIRALPARTGPLPAGTLGLGGDEAGPLPAPLGPVLVVGPARSGRSTALARLVGAHRAAGRTVTEVVGTGPGTAVPGAVGPATGSTVVTAADVARDPAAGTVLVLDDLDVLLRADLALDDAVTAWLREGRVVVASARTDRVAAAYRGALTALRDTTLLVLDPAHPGSGDASGADLALHADPGAATGRGVLVRAGAAVTPVQVASP